MSNEYKRLKEELDGTNLDSILPGFDREASWKELSPRLKKVPKRTYWLGYAAALVAIIVVAWMIRMQMTKPEAPDNIAKVTPEQPAITDTNDSVNEPQSLLTTTPEKTVALQQSAKNEAKHKATRKTKTQIEKLQPAETVAEDLIANSPLQPSETNKVPDEVPQPVVTQVKPLIKRPKAVHLLDIDNENRQAAIQNSKELQQGLPQRIVNLLPGRPYSNTENDRKPSSLFKVN